MQVSAARQRTAQPARPEAQPLHQCHHRCPRARRSKWFHANRRPAPALSSLWAGASRTSTAAPTRARQHARRVQMGAPLRQVARAGDLSRSRSLCAAGSMPFSNMVGWGSRADHAPRGGRRALRAAGCLGGGLAPRAQPAPTLWAPEAARGRRGGSRELEILCSRWRVHCPTPPTRAPRLPGGRRPLPVEPVADLAQRDAYT